MSLNEIYKKNELVFKREGNNDPFDYSDGNDTENYLLKIIEEAGDLSIASPHWQQYVHDWPTRYHLSPQRADLLRPFKNAFKGKSILEIGAGCGAITRFLGETGAKVTSLEGSLRRAKITAARCRDLDNVEVVCDNFQDFVSDSKYDFVVLVGVLEYSNVFVNSASPAKDVLIKSASFMNAGGNIIVAIENKLGLKYWAGAPEDHVGEAFFGLENRYHQKTACTYGKQELAELLASAGFGEQEFLYSFPDYKLPSIIIRSAGIESADLDLKNLIVPATDHPQFKSYNPVFSPERVWKEVISNGLTADLANSFLVIASATSVNEILPADTLAYIYSSGRYPAFRKANTFARKGADIFVERSLINPGYTRPENYSMTQLIETEQYIPGKIYFLGFLDIITKNGWTIEQLVQWCRPWFNHMRSLSCNQDGELMLPGDYLDLTPMNLLQLDDGSTRHFDQEWTTGDLVPLHYILVRGLYFCFSRPLYFHEPDSGTALDVFALIREIAGNFLSTDSDIVTLFKELEHRYFGPVSLTPDYVPVDFTLNLLPSEDAKGHNVQTLPVAPLKNIVLSAVVATDIGETRSPKISVALDVTPEPFPLRVNTSMQLVKKLEIAVGNQGGLLNLYAIDITNDLGRVVYSWTAEIPTPLNLVDIVPLASNGDNRFYNLVLFEGNPSIVFDEATFQNESSSYFDIIIYLSAPDIEQADETKTALRNLLSVTGFTDDDIFEDNSVRNQLAQTAQRFAKNGRADLELKLAESGALIEGLTSQSQVQQAEVERLHLLEAHAAGLEQENARLRRDVEWFSNTYEKRSLFGIAKTKFKNFVKRIYLFFLHFFIKSGFVQKRYAVKYMLEYTRDNGLGTSIKSVRANFSKHGLSTITRSRQLALEAISREASANAPRPPDPIPEEIYPVEMMKADISTFISKPLFSVIMPTYNTKPALLKLAIESVRNQVYENWELCIADDGSTNAETKNFLKTYSGDSRIKIVFMPTNGGISAASNEAISLSSGQYLALFDHDDELAPDALYWICREINEHSGVDIIYTDECKKNEAGDKSDYFLKPDWSPNLLLNMMYVGHFTVYNKQFLLEKVGTFRSAYDFSQDYDLMLRATEHTDAIRHIDKVLYYWRQTEGSAAVGDKPYARQSNIAALEDAVRRRNIDGVVIELPTANRVKLNLTDQPMVSVIIPTDSFDNLTATIESIAASTSYTNYEIVPVTNSQLISQLENKYADLPMNFVRYDKPYNFSDKCNAGASGCNGSIVLFLNDDVRPLQNDWIENTIEYLELPGVGGVSPKLIYEDDTIQYAGMVTGVRNLTGTSFHCYPRNSTAYINFPQLTREVSILSGACLAMKKDLFLGVGGFDAINAPSAHSDVDLSFKIIEKGFRCIYTPYAELRHIGHLSLKTYEEKETKKKKDKADIFLLNRWPGYVAVDPYFPDTMRNLLYHDSPVPMAIYGGRERAYKPGNKDVLLVCHDLTRSGAPIMLYNICTMLMNNGYFVVLCCAKDGPLREMYQELGVNVIIDPLIVFDHPTFEKFAINFDYIIANTVVNFPAVKQMQDKVKTIWWLQEAKVIDHFIDQPGFIPTLQAARNIIGVSDYSLNMVKKYNRHYTKIYNACYDFYEPAKHDKDLAAKIRFTIVGSIESRKGHDILFDALDLLEPEVTDRLQVSVVGRVLDPAFKQMISEKIRDKNYISFTGEINNAGAVKEVADSDVIICPSRDDPFPVVLVEAFCMAKTCVVSDATGFAELIKDDETGFVFPTENAAALADIIRQIVLDPPKIERIGNNAREIYLNELSIPVLEQRLLKYLDRMQEPKSLKVDKPGKPVKENVTVFQEEVL